MPLSVGNPLGYPGVAQTPQRPPQSISQARRDLVHLTRDKKKEGTDKMSAAERMPDFLAIFSPEVKARKNIITPETHAAKSAAEKLHSNVFPTGASC